MSKIGEPTTCNPVGASSFIMGLLGGTGCSIILKLLYQVRAQGVDGDERSFEKPLFLTFVMFLAMMFALPASWILEQFKAPERRQREVPARVLWSLVVPSVFDLAGTTLAQTGLVYTTVSYFQLLRCTVIIVTAFLKAFVLSHRLKTYMWWGVGVNIIAMIMVSMTNFMEPSDEEATEAKNVALGAFFILLSCVVQGSQYIFEEKVMTVDNAPPLVVIGMEGFWGTLIMTIVVLPMAAAFPGQDLGSIENTWDSLSMVSNSYTVQIMLFAFFITVTTYNIFCIYVTAYLSAVWHAILDNFRPVSVWAVDLAIFYLVTSGSFGEAWTPYSWLQLVGMLVLFLGTTIYNGSVRLPFLVYEDTTNLLPKDGPADVMSSPALMRSPLLRRLSLEYENPNPMARALKAAAAEHVDLEDELGRDGDVERDGQGLLGETTALNPDGATGNGYQSTRDVSRS